MILMIEADDPKAAECIEHVRFRKDDPDGKLIIMQAVDRVFSQLAGDSFEAVIQIRLIDDGEPFPGYQYVTAWGSRLK